MSMSSPVLISELVMVDHGKYIVKVLGYGNGVVLGSGLAAANTIEEAEDKARQRTIELINLSQNQTITDTKMTALDNEPKIVETKSPMITSPNNTIPTSPEVKTPEKLTTNPPLTIPQEKAESTPKLPVNPPTEIPLESPELNLTPPPVPSSVNNGQGTSADSPSSLPETTESVDFNQIMNQTNIELQRLNWTQEDGKKYLLETYGKKSRHLLKDEQLIEFLQYLKQL